MSSTGNKNVVITKAARMKMVRARSGDVPLPKVVGMAFGNGGVDASGTIKPPLEGQTALFHELYRKEIQSHSYPDDTTCEYVCTLNESELAGEEISEVGLYDEDGDILCIKTFARKGKDDDVEQTYTLDDKF